jgi:hypothetical protein
MAAHGHFHGIVHDDMTLLGTNKGVTIILINNSRKNEDFILKRLFSFFIAIYVNYWCGNYQK